MLAKASTRPQAKEKPASSRYSSQWGQWHIDCAWCHNRQLHMRSRIFIVDDHHDFAKALRYVFAETPELEACGTATDLEEAFRLIPFSDADLVTLDIRLSGSTSLRHLPNLRSVAKNVPFLVISSEDPAVFGDRARKAGASGYLAKGTPPSEIVRAARLLLARCEYFPCYGSWRKGREDPARSNPKSTPRIDPQR